MKKNLWLLGVAVAALTSCTQSEVLDVPESRTIQFDTFVGKSTRAAVQINQKQTSDIIGGQYPMDNLWQFWVFGTDDGVAEFTGTDERAKVYFKSATEGFTYDNHMSWQMGGHIYNFAAYSNGNYPLTDSPSLEDPILDPSELQVRFSDLEDGSENIVGSQLFFDNYTVGNLDLLAAISPTITTPQSGQMDPVNFQFQHLLSLIEIELYNNTQDVYLQVSNITVPGITTDDCAFLINPTASSDESKKREQLIAWANMYPDYDDDLVTGYGENDDCKKLNYTFNGTPAGIQESEPYSTYLSDYVNPGSKHKMLYFVIPQSNQGATNIELRTKSFHMSNINNGEGTPALTGTGDETKTYTISLALNETYHGIHKSWQPGYIYKYKGNMEGTANYIHFGVSVNKWTPYPPTNQDGSQPTINVPINTPNT